MASEDAKVNRKRRPLGVIIVAIVSFMFGFGGILVGLSGLYIQPYLSLYALATGSILLVTGVGMLELKRWAWYLAVCGCIFGLAIYTWSQSPQGFPLEIMVLPYLIWKRKTFGVTGKGEMSE
jgi:uncharacterized membrane protein